MLSGLATASLPIESPPYYAMRVWPKVHYKMGSLQIDTLARVISLEQEPVKGSMRRER